MSSEHQRFSPENQAAAIAKFASDRGLSIVRTYLDEGRSGLTLSGREGLKQLLRDVIDGNVDYSAILVLDVSRWGRFQDPDQGAHYEYLCREAGISVHYCAEAFESDGSAAAAIMKNIRRVMAAEFSRDLSRRVYDSQVRGAERGYKQGGFVTLGVRRAVLISDLEGNRILSPGERKSFDWQRVTLIHGPANELQAIRKIFDWYARKALGFKEISRRLSAQGFQNADASKITDTQIRRIVSNEVYIGVYTYNKTSQRLGSKQVKNPEDLWIRTKIFEPIVSEKLFSQALARLSRTRPRPSDEALLDHLKRIQKRHGRVTTKLLKEDLVSPDPGTYYKRFGTFINALSLAGISPEKRTYRKPIGSGFSDEVIVAGLKRLLKTHGYLASWMIDEDDALPRSSYVKFRFGSFGNAYRAAGWQRTDEEIRGINATRQWTMYRAQKSGHVASS